MRRVLYYDEFMKNMTMQSAVRFYEGDVPDTKDPLYSDPKAYVTLNAVFFPGTENERIKIREHRFLNPAFFLRWQEVFGEEGITSKIFEAMRVSGGCRKNLTWRVEREQDFAEMCRQKRTVAFTSTSSSGFLSSYGDKLGIVLLEFHLDETVPALDLADFLSYYAKKDESEILLPPFLGITVKKTELSSDEKKITDQNGNPPSAKYIVTCGGFSFPQTAESPITSEVTEEAAEFCRRLNHGLDAEKFEQSYLLCKRALLAQTVSCFRRQFQAEP